MEDYLPLVPVLIVAIGFGFGLTETAKKNVPLLDIFMLYVWLCAAVMFSEGGFALYTHFVGAALPLRTIATIGWLAFLVTLPLSVAIADVAFSLATSRHPDITKPRKLLLCIFFAGYIGITLLCLYEVFTGYGSLFVWGLYL